MLRRMMIESAFYHFFVQCYPLPSTFQTLNLELVSVRIRLTTEESVTKHGQAIRRGFDTELVCTVWICSANTNSLMKPVRIA